MKKEIIKEVLNNRIMKRKAKIYYVALDDFWRKEKKLECIRENPISQIAFERIEPDDNYKMAKYLIL